MERLQVPLFKIRWSDTLCSVLFEGYHIKWPGKALSTLKGHTIVQNCPNSQWDTRVWKTECKDQGCRIPLVHSRGGSFNIKLSTFKLRWGINPWQTWNQNTGQKHQASYSWVFHQIKFTSLSRFDETLNLAFPKDIPAPNRSNSLFHFSAFYSQISVAF